MSVEAYLTYFTQEIRTLSLDKICTSVAIGFYIKDLAAFTQFKTKLTQVSKLKHSIFTCFEHTQVEKTVSKTQTVLLNPYDDDDEGFEML